MASLPITVLQYNGPLLCGFNVRIKWLILFSLCPLYPVTDISARVAPIGVKFCMMIHIGGGQVFSPVEGDAQGDPPNPKIWT